MASYTQPQTQTPLTLGPFSYVIRIIISNHINLNHGLNSTDAVSALIVFHDIQFLTLFILLTSTKVFMTKLYS